MDIEEIVETFAEHKAALDKFYRSNQKTPDHKWQPEQDYLVILNGLLREHQQTKMYLKIKAEYAKDSVNNVSSNVRLTLTFQILCIFNKFNLFNRILARESVLERNGARMGVVDIHG